MRRLQQILHDNERIGADIVKLRQVGERFGDLAAHHLLEQIEHAAAIRQSQHAAHAFGVDRLAFLMRDGLIQQRKRVAHRTFGGARDQCQRAILDLHAFIAGDHFQMRDKLRRFDAAQIEALAARQHRHRHFADFGGGEDELHMRRRLFQRLEQAVERLLRQHVHFVDDVDLVARAGGRIAHAVDDLADIVDAGARGRVHFQHVDVAAFGDGDAGLAYAAGMDGRLGALAVRPDAVERAGDDARGGGLSHAAHAGQHEGMGDAARGEGVGEGTDQRFLPDQPGEVLRPVFAGQNAIRLAFLGRVDRESEVFIISHEATIARPTRAARQFRRPSAKIELWKGGSRPRPEADSVRLLPSGPDRVRECTRPRPTSV